MPEHRLERLRTVAGTRPVRYAALFALLTTLVMGAALAFLSWHVISLLERHIEEGIQQQLRILRDDFAQNGRASLLGLVRRHEGEDIHFQVQDGGGRVLAGDLPATQLQPGWQDLSFVDTEGNHQRHRVLALELDDDTVLAVSSDTADLARTRWFILGACGTGLVVTVVLALAGGLVIGRAVLRQVDAINRTAAGIMEGDLAQRVPTSGPDDELGQLAENLNRMLARIEELMANVRHVSDAIAHDLRTPLGRLRQRLEACRLRPRSEAEYALVLDDAMKDIDALLRTFESMLRIAQIEAGAGRSRFGPVDLAAVVGNVCEAFEAVAEEEGKRLDSVAPPGFWIDGDRELLTQMIANLVENALHHTPAGTVVTVGLDRVDGAVQLTISDTGPGIPAADRERVFRRFYRRDVSRSTPGSGLGLSLVGAIGRLHNAAIRLEDNEPRGLRVVARFPSRAAPPNGSGTRTLADVVPLPARPGPRIDAGNKRGNETCEV